MLHQVVIVQGYQANFHICEAWEIAKKYLPESVPSSASPGSPTIGDPGPNRPEAGMIRKTGDNRFATQLTANAMAF